MSTTPTNTNLITQAVISDLQAQIDIIRNNLAVANLNLQSITNTLTVNLATAYADLSLQLTNAITMLTNLINGYNTTLLGLLNSHIAATYATAHGGISAAVGEYRDSANDIVGSRVVSIVIGGITYYIPASPTSGGTCYTPPCACVAACHFHCHYDGPSD